MASFTVEQCVAPLSPARLVRRFAKLATVYVEERLNGSEMSFHQWIALKVTSVGVVENAGELSRELAITTGATTRLIDNLERRGLMARERCGEDRRVVRITVTPAGAAVVARLQPKVVAAWNDLFQETEQEDAEAFVRTLAKLYERVERLTGRNEPLEEHEQ